MRYVGRVVEWNADRGFGFVVPNGGVERTFAHISAFERKPRGGVEGLLVSFEIGRDAKGRNVASDVRLVRPGATNRHQRAQRRTPRVMLAAASLAALALGSLFWKIPAVFVLVYVAMSIATAMVYAFDKAAAMNNRWRVQESTLHALALLGGWPGSLYAQGAYRHKSTKTSFQVMFWMTVVANCVGLAWLIDSGHAAAIQLAILGP